jgi:hypothetical protein
MWLRIAAVVGAASLVAGCDDSVPAGRRADAGADAGTRDAGARDADVEPRDAGDAGDDGGGSDPPEAGPDPADAGALPYPVRDPMRLKELQPDFWPSMDEIAGNNTGGVAMNLVWAHWEPERRAAPCAADDVTYDGHCFVVSRAVDDAIAAWSARGLAVTAIVYGVPAWARTGNTGCSPAAPGFEIFCSPDDARDYGRFAGMLARRYDGRHDRGRVADFVIHNEVNANEWFDIGCGDGVPCDPDRWIRTYADDYAAAYDAIVAEQSTARAYFSFEHHFAASYDAPGGSPARLSVETFVTRLAPMLGERQWRLAYHPYAPDLFSPDFSADDWPRVTYGNIGTLLGWLHARFPSEPHAWQVHLTESGINSSAPRSSEARQAAAVCDGLRNVLGTPGIEAYVYHRMQDNPAEGGLALGLARADGTLKPAWARWALSNRADLSPPMLSCGFEDLPYTRLVRSAHPTRGHWASTRIAPAGFVPEQAWRLLRAPAPGTVLLFSCVVGGHAMLTRAADCEGQRPEGPVGYAYDADGAGRVALHRCTVGGGADHFVSPDPGYEGQTHESLLGYALAP